MIRRQAHLSGALAGALLALLAGCVSIRSHNKADPYIISHHTWWNYYQRGRLYVRDGSFDKAQKDFETALGIRSGARQAYAQERWRVRTYGMHTLESYFPHRELAVCLYNKGALKEALKLMETSMQMEPSARAKFYLNQIHRQLAVEAAPAPSLEIVKSPEWTIERSIMIEGSAVGSNEVSSITISGVPEFIELASHQIHFSREIRLKEGRNQIPIAAKDVSGKSAFTNLTIMADWTPPQIQLDRKGSNLVITCKDNIELKRISINGKLLTPKSKIHSFDWPIKKNTPVKLLVADSSGNTLDWSLSAKELSHLAQKQQEVTPVLKIPDAGKTITLFNSEYVLDICAEDDTSIRQLELNGESLLKGPSPLFRTLRRIPLALGANKLTISAIDFDGNYAEEHITVIRRNPEFLDRKYRLAALQSSVSGEIPSRDFAQRFDRITGHALTKEPERFFLLASEEESKKLSNERDLSNSALADPRALLKQGRKLNADLSFMTRVISDAPGQTIYTRVLDTGSGEELCVDDIYLENTEDLDRQINGLVMKIEQRFPLLKASVQRLERDLIIDAGSSSGAHLGMRFIVIRSDGPFEQGRVVQNDGRPTELVISEIESETAQVIISRGQSSGSVRSGDYVFTR